MADTKFAVPSSAFRPTMVRIRAVIRDGSGTGPEGLKDNTSHCQEEYGTYYLTDHIDTYICHKEANILCLLNRWPIERAL